MLGIGDWCLQNIGLTCGVSLYRYRGCFFKCVLLPISTKYLFKLCDVISLVCCNKICHGNILWIITIWFSLQREQYVFVGNIGDETYLL